MSIDLAKITLQLEGAASPPANMIEAARQSLSAAGFDLLMQHTGGKSPTPAQLCAVADAERMARESLARLPADDTLN